MFTIQDLPMQDLTIRLVELREEDAFKIIDKRVAVQPLAMEACMWSHIPQELVGTILFLLPPSSQARFCCVCKQ